MTPLWYNKALYFYGIRNSFFCQLCKRAIIPFKNLADVNGGHGGGDNGIVEDVYNVFALGQEPKTSLAESLESHIIGIKAEEERLKFN